ADQLPDHLLPRSPVYQMDIRGAAPTQLLLTIPIPNESTPYETLRVYAWNAEQWAHIPNQILVANDIIEAYLDYTPESFMVMQTNPPIPAVTADLGLNGQL